ncbi:MAG: glutathione S-transferase family protein [Flavobacteriaceae bacterium]
MYTLYSSRESGNSYKPRLIMALLGIPYRAVEVSPLDGTTRKPDFLARNPNGKVPVLEFEDGRFLAESNAMLVYLSENSPFFPKERYKRGKVMEWLFFEQYSHEPNIAVRQALSIYPERRHQATPERMQQLLEGGNRALAVMEQRLTHHPYLVGDRYTIADIALYAYTHQADQGGFDLGRYPAIRQWLSRVSTNPDHVAIND